METSLDARARLIFDEVLDLHPDERPSAIARACGSDGLLLQRVECLLAAAEKDDVFLRDPTLAEGQPEATARGIASEQPGSRVGPYRILELLGEGGFGSVFIAEQLEPVRRRVALKIVKLGMDTRAVVARFEQERQALAMMDHPNIARVFDAGMTDTGRPYFVMELVRGDPITSYCDQVQFSIVERASVFVQVCRAVQHAHTKGVIHRDIKPSNVLVSTVDGRPSVKIIDFGIAKATDQRLTEKTIFTEFRQLIGTPEYMSPEQAAGSLDIDTRSDVYSLGVLFYELLTGSTPFDARELRSAAFGEMQRIIREIDPPPPSTRVSHAKDALAGIAALRRTPPGRLGPIIRGELDWIVMRTLDKDRARRYDSAGDLGADVERFLRGEPVEAAPPGAIYKLRKALRRNRLAVGTAGAVGIALMVGTGIALWQARIASTERDAARASATEADEARNESELRRRETEQVAEFEAARLKAIKVPDMGASMLVDLVENARAGMKRRNLAQEEIDRRAEQLFDLLADVNKTDLALRTLDQNIFEGAINAVDEQFKDQPLIAARLLNTLGEIMLDLGLTDRASEPLLRAAEIRRRDLGDLHIDTLAAIGSVGELRLAQSRHAEAETLLRELVAGRKQLLGPDDPKSLSAANNLAMSMLLQGRMAEAEPVLTDLQPRIIRALGPDHPESIAITMNMGGVMFELGRPADAEPYFKDALASYRRISARGPEPITCMSNLALSIEKQGRLADAEPLYREAMETARTQLGEEHPYTLLFKSNLGYLLCSMNRLTEAEALTSEALNIRRRLLGEAHRDTLQSTHNMGVLLIAKNDPAAAERHFRDAIAGRLAESGGGHWSVTQSRDAYSKLLAKQGRFPEAERILLDAQRETTESKHSSGKQRDGRASALAAFYDEWERAEPGSGYAAQAARWRDATGSSAP